MYDDDDTSGIMKKKNFIVKLIKLGLDLRLLLNSDTI